MTKYVQTEEIDGILKVTINRPDKKNALLPEMYTALADAIDHADADDKIRVLFITGSGDSFTAGNDLKDFLNNSTDDEDRPVNRFLGTIAQAQTPLVTAVNGLAIGVGVTMLLHCDLNYASETARFQMPFVDLAVVPEAGSSYLLPRMMGRQQAAELLMLGEMFSAAKAQAVGIINDVFESDRLQEIAWQKALSLSQKPPEALKLTKNLLRKGDLATTIEFMREEGKLFRERLVSDESREVMMAFFEKRQPNF